MPDTIIISSAPVSSVIVTAGEQGPPGPPGVSTIIILPFSISGHKVLTITETGYTLADKDTFSHMGKVIGLTNSAFNAGVAIPLVTTGGVLTGLSYLQIGLPVYLGNDGSITQTVPTTGFLQQLGVASSTSEIIINISFPIQLGV